MAIELVCGAEFWCKRHYNTSPVVLEGFGGQLWPKIGRKPIRKFPARLPSGTQLGLAHSSIRDCISEEDRLMASAIRREQDQAAVAQWLAAGSAEVDHGTA